MAIVYLSFFRPFAASFFIGELGVLGAIFAMLLIATCLLYTSDAADERSSVDLGGRRILKKKKQPV